MENETVTASLYDSYIMRATRITQHVHYIGVNDRTSNIFEGMWPLPYGVSYNSYIVTGDDKVAIIDGVEAGHALAHIDLIKEILGDRQPDYLIVNHMEPDHSGAIRMLRQAFPEITIVGNAQTLCMIRGFYGVESGTLAIKDGDTLPLGSDITLRFCLTPMVHWPETMVTYLEEEKVLFSGDAFGCFGALAGAVVDDDMNTDIYFSEMVRYYSNIVGKYGMFVQRAMKKLEGVPVDMVCSTHGPVWHSRIADVMDIYDRLSRYEPLDNGATIVYGSMYGNTEAMAEAAAEALAAGGVRDISVLNVSKTDLSYILADIFRHRGLIIAAPTYSDSLFPPVAAVMEAMAIRGVKNREVALLGSHTWSQQALKVMTTHIEACGMQCMAEPVSVKHAPAHDDLAKCREAASAMAVKLTGR